MSDINPVPFMSVVVLSLNGEKTIAKAIKSLTAQTYPKDRYEIIAVNDGSTDKTAEIMQSFPNIRYINNPTNLGIAESRNVGLRAAKGDIYVTFDDDCHADPRWLENLAKGYQLDRPAGVGGLFVRDTPVKGLANNYVTAKGGPLPIRHDRPDAKPNAWLRLYRYYTTGLHAADVLHTPYIEVNELYGANGSYPITILKAIGGWKPEMTWIEDRDLSLRIRIAYPKLHFYTMTDALVMHNDDVSLRAYLLRPFKRGNVQFRFYKNHGITPAIFPSPIIFIACCLLMAVLKPILLPLGILLVPIMLYYWWPIRSIAEKKPMNLVFCYIQLAEETMVLVGLLRGSLSGNGTTS